MASRFAARPTGRLSATKRPLKASDYAKAYLERRGSNEVEENDGDESTYAFPMWKSVAIGVILIACFASIYPKILHPMLMYAFGHGDRTNNKPTVDTEGFPRQSIGGGRQGHAMHPSFGGSPMPGADRYQSPAARMSSRMPGMGSPADHFAAESEGRSGAWHWLLPFYTIGIVVFLLYTLSKVLWKKPQINVRHRYNLRYNSSKDRFEANIPGMETEDEEVEGEENSMFGGDDDEEDVENEEEAPDLNAHALGNRELINLQSRLQETESAMQHILSQLEHLSSTADPSKVEEVKKVATKTLTNLTNATGRNLITKDDSPEPNTVQTYEIAPIAEKRKPAKSALPSFIDTGEPSYIGDVEKALIDFQRFSDNYVRQYSQKGGQLEKAEAAKQSDKESESELEKENVEATSFDVMQSDQLTTEPLTVELGEGELVSICDQNSRGEVSSKTNLLEAVLETDSFLDNDKSNRDNGNRKKNVRQRKNRKAAKTKAGDS